MNERIDVPASQLKSNRPMMPENVPRFDPNRQEMRNEEAS